MPGVRDSRDLQLHLVQLPEQANPLRGRGCQWLPGAKGGWGRMHLEVKDGSETRGERWIHRTGKAITVTELFFKMGSFT